MAADTNGASSLEARVEQSHAVMLATKSLRCHPTLCLVANGQESLASILSSFFTPGRLLALSSCNLLVRFLLLATKLATKLAVMANGY